MIYFSRGTHITRRCRGVASVCAAALLVITAFAPHGIAASKPKPKALIKFATVAPEGSTWMKIMHELDEDVRAATENRLGFKFYPGGVQGDEKDVLRKIRNGQLHAGGFSGFGLGAIAPEFRVIELPFMFRDLGEVDKVRGSLDSFYTNLFDSKGYLLAGWADVGFVYVFSNTPITSPDELRRSRIWIWSGDLLAELFFKAFSVSPIPLALPDVLTSLQMGVIDATYAPPLACIALQWFTRVKYMSNVPITYGFGAMLISNKALKKVAPEDIDILKTITRKHSQALIDKTRVQNLEAIDAIRNEGVELLNVDEATMNVFFSTGKNAWTDGIGKLYPKDLLDRVTSILAEYRKNEASPGKSP
jgi:TRAP-type C4-dicarboxylate transport system substrate-binding protein